MFEFKIFEVVNSYPELVTSLSVVVEMIKSVIV